MKWWEKDGGSPEPLFAEFWRRGEIALLFGPAGVGKSLLAVQIADALARGRPIAGVEMPKKRSNVLYVDLILSEAQFSARYSRDTNRKSKVGRYIFSVNLYRERPKESRDLANWIERTCLENSCSVVIVDDLSAVSRSNDGTRETLPLIHELKVLSLKHGLSILVLADSIETPGTRDAGEADLRRSQVLCSFVDSVFMIEGGRCAFRKLSQTRSTTGMRSEDHMKCELAELESGLLGFAFEAAAGHLSSERIAEILKIKEMSDGEMSLRDIAAATGIHRNTVARRLKQWTPQLYEIKEAMQEEDEYGYDEAEEREASRIYGFDTRPGRHEPWLEEDEPIEAETLTAGYNVAKIPFAAGLGHRSVFDLDIRYDVQGRIFYVESKDSGKPMIWYTVHQKTGVITRHVRRGDAVHQTRLRSEWI